jgi:hypothetical protein
MQDVHFLNKLLPLASSAETCKTIVKIWQGSFD